MIDYLSAHGTVSTCCCGRFPGCPEKDGISVPIPRKSRIPEPGQEIVQVLAVPAVYGKCMAAADVEDFLDRHAVPLLARLEVVLPNL